VDLALNGFHIAAGATFLALFVPFWVNVVGLGHGGVHGL
jgi:hypothetical protein